MSPHRRDVLKGLGSAAALAAFGELGAQVSQSAAAPVPNGESSQAPSFPRKADFDIESGYTYTNGDRVRA
jgi:hypothetical protein